MLASQEIRGLKKVGVFLYPVEAYIVKSLLESNNIEVFMFDEFMVLMDNFRSNAVGGIKLYVKEDSMEDARDIISSYKREVTYRKDYSGIYEMSRFFIVWFILVILGSQFRLIWRLLLKIWH
ncbi:MAG: DUF2007 domain-containing protein [Caldiserica bacterium]|nr:DUF2007 domain-containing protein [Caldisericota bacterium]